MLINSVCVYLLFLLIDNGWLVYRNYYPNSQLECAVSLPQYGSILNKIAANHVKITYMMNFKDFHSHDVCLNERAIRSMLNSKLIILNGLNYEGEIEKIASIAAKRGIIVARVSDIVNAHQNTNPHLWFNTEVYSVLPQEICRILCVLKPECRYIFLLNLKLYQIKYGFLCFLVEVMKGKMRGKTYLSNENIYDDFLNSLHARKLAISSLHSDECEDLSLYQLEKLIKMKKNLRPDFIVINRQVNNAFTKILCTMSKDLNIPLILVDEIMPEKYDCVLLWQINQLLEINTALQKN